MYKINKNKKTNKKSRSSGRSWRRLIVVAMVVVLVLGGAYGLYAYNNRNDRSADTAKTPDSEAADPDFTGGTEREPAKPVEKNGGVRDTSGEKDEPDDDQAQNDPIVSDSGRISVYMPREGQLLKSGDTVSGTAKVDRVWYRLMDDQVGNLTQGSLEVTDGRFSGVFDFDTGATNGRLDIFSMTSDGVEADNIEISIKFK